MCDTLALHRGGTTWLAKNSDRDPLEAQRVEIVPAVRGDRSKSLRCTWIEIPQVPDRHACIIGRPAWMWGAEMGVNECGLAIGNEAIFSRRVRRRGAALLGMDLVRLALERAASAEQALQLITDLLEKYGQGGPAGYTQRDFRYDNSFLIADGKGAWKLETAGRYWAAQRVPGEDSISNALTIERDYEIAHPQLLPKRVDFRGQYDTWLLPFFGASRGRRESSLAALRQLQTENAGFADFARILRSHRGNAPSGNGDLCMHAAAPASPLKFLRPSATANAMIVRIDSDGPRAVFTGTPHSCTSLFKPVGFSGNGGGDWAVCGADIWERHRVWEQHSNLTPAARLSLQAQIERAEAEIFAGLDGGDLRAADRAAADWSNRIYARAQPDNNHFQPQETL